MSVFDTEAYAEARRNRLANLFRHVAPESLTEKRVLELGCGTGELGEEFVKLGCVVTSVDARLEHIEELRKRFPSRKAAVLNLDTMHGWGLGTFDAVLCFGLLYHLANPLAFLLRCRRLAPALYLETIVLDSAVAECPADEESGDDQSFMQMGCRPSPAWLLKVLGNLGYDVTDISGLVANWSTARFDWTPQNDGNWRRDGVTLRKMLICQQRG